MDHGLGALQALQLGHHVLDLFGAVAVGHQQGVGRVDDEQVLGAERDHRAVGCVDVGVLRERGEALALDAVAVGVGGREFGHGVPAADIAPGAGVGHHGHLGMVLHDGIVDALRAAGREGAGQRLDPLRG